MPSEVNLNKSGLFFAVVGSVFMLPVFFYFIGFVLYLESIIEILSWDFSVEKAYIWGAMQQHTGLQIEQFALIIPGLIVTTVNIVIFKFNEVWFRKLHKAYIYFLIMNPPIFTLTGFYLLWLMRQRDRA